MLMLQYMYGIKKLEKMGNGGWGGGDKGSSGNHKKFLKRRLKWYGPCDEKRETLHRKEGDVN